MSRHSTYMSIAFACCALAAPALAAGGELYEGDLDPAPFDASNKPDVQGAGDLTAVLDGRSLTVTGNFSGLSAPATGAQVRMGLAMGVPGDSIGTLTAAHAASGTISGMIMLNAKQLAALKSKSLYVRIDSEKAPDGSLMGWLLPVQANQ